MGITNSETIAVLLMAYGSPESLEDMEAYLLDIRSGRPTTPELVAEMQSRYTQIGGRSPLLEITRAQAAALEEELRRRSGGEGLRFRCYAGMRHWQPRIQEALADIASYGIHQVIGLVMAPHQSRMSTGAYFKKLEEARANLGLEDSIEIIPVGPWHDAGNLISALAENASQALSRFEQTPYVLFTAHSLPARILEQGDPYDAQLHRTAELVAGRLNLAPGRWQFCYQSAGKTSEPWLGPSIEQVVQELAQAGEKNLLVVPVGFVCDHVEILYDVDIAARGIARQYGARLERPSSLNTTPTFIQALADVVSAAWEAHSGAQMAAPASSPGEPGGPH